MAQVSRSRRSAAGIALIVAGALVLLVVILPLVGASLPWVAALSWAALAVALVILALGAVNNNVAKIALFTGAVGFAILALAGFGIPLPAILLTIGGVLAALGILVGAIVLYVGKEVANNGALVFVIAAILAALILLGVVAALGLAPLGTLFSLALGVALVLAGVLFYRAENHR
jgi:hypothetical protein